MCGKVKVRLWAGSQVAGSPTAIILRNFVSHAESDRFADWSAHYEAMGALADVRGDGSDLMSPFFARVGGRTVCGARGRHVFVEEMGRFCFVAESYGGAPAVPAPPGLWPLQERVKALLANVVAEDPFKGAFINVVRPGGSVAEHMDSRVMHQGGTCSVVRCNIIVQMGQGGAPVIGDDALGLSAGDGWMFMASEVRHRSQEVSGGKSRIIVSMGFLVKPEAEVVVREEEPGGMEVVCIQGSG